MIDFMTWTSIIKLCVMPDIDTVDAVTDVEPSIERRVYDYKSAVLVRMWRANASSTRSNVILLSTIFNIYIESICHMAFV